MTTRSSRPSPFQGPAVALAILLAVTLLAAPAAADPPPDPISIDAHSPSIFLCAVAKNAADIYGVAGAILGAGCDVAMPGPILHVPAGGYGLTGQDENDGHSAGELDPFQRVAVYFSGDRASQGAVGTEYETQEQNLQAAGDRFVTNGFTTNSPAAAFGACAPVGIGPAAFPLRGINLLSLNQDRYQEIPSIRPNILNRLRYLDNLDAVELDQFDLDNDQQLDRPIYFTVDKVGPTFAGRPSDIFVTFPGGAPIQFAPANWLGVTNRDNVDALAVYDVDGDGQATPGVDYALFSLDRGSPSLGGNSAADILVTNFTGTYCVYLRAASLGLQRCDNVDALDVEIGEVEVFEQEPIEEEIDVEPVDPTDPDDPVVVSG